MAAALSVCCAGVATAGADDNSYSRPLSLAVEAPAKAGAAAPAMQSQDIISSRGLITQQGQAGMFLNPTSGTLVKGALTAQYCVLFRDYDTELVGHGLMLEYGVTDWLGIGGFGTAVDPPNSDIIAVGGPQFRIRAVQEQTWIPEVTLGGIWLDGSADDDGLSKIEGWVAISKGFAIDPDGFLKSARVHAGFRYAALPEHPADIDDQYFVYGGVELAFPYNLSLVGEIQSTNLDSTGGGDKVPYAIGVQWKPTSVLGLSAAHMRPFNLQEESFYFGVGLNFKL